MRVSIMVRREGTVFQTSAVDRVLSGLAGATLAVLAASLTTVAISIIVVGAAMLACRGLVMARIAAVGAERGGPSPALDAMAILQGQALSEGLEATGERNVIRLGGVLSGQAYAWRPLVFLRRPGDAVAPPESSIAEPGD